MFAYCYAGGVIDFGAKIPDGALPIARGKREALYSFISGVARHAYDGETLLVPGLPEAEDQMKGLDALKTWTMWISKGAPKGVVTIHSKHFIR